jgi:Carboxypeptidase regulatory-like domain
MRTSAMSRSLLAWLAVAVMLCGFTLPLPGQGTSGRIVGRISDPSGAVLANVKITLTNQATGVSRDTLSNSTGDYVLVEVVPGVYTVQFELTGFKKDVHKNITVEVNQVVTLNAVMQVGGEQETVEVTSEAPQVDTTSTQLGAVVNDRSVNQLPLNTRDTYQFLQLQPGVQSQLGSSGSLFYGSDEAGSVSVNGGRSRANNFSVNGGDANDQFVNLPTVQPSPDSIEEFRVITNTFDAEYGRNSGAVVNVITKSGTNKIHGDIYEYFRNKVLNAQGYFNTVKPQFNQNQFGGTLGGPIKKDRTFFFLSYEGRRIRQGESGPFVTVPTSAERSGDFSSVTSISAPTADSPNAISDQFVADALNGRPGCTAAITGLGGTTPAAGVAWNSVFPTSVIPAPCQDPVAVSLLNSYIPQANVATGGILNGYQSVPSGADNQDQFTIRLDHKINARQSFTAYYYYTDDANTTPFDNFEAAGANVPGFGSAVDSRYQQVNLSHTWTVSNSVVNEARFTYMREGQLGFQIPQHTGAVTDSCTGAAAAFCFTGLSDSSAINALASDPATGDPKFGVTPGLSASRTGVPFIAISGGPVIGNNAEGQLPQVGNSFQWSDNLTWVKGNHTMKFGLDLRRQRFDQTLYYNVNGQMTFDGSGSDAMLMDDGNNYGSYLLGLVDSFGQGGAQVENVRSTSVYPFAEDSWKIKPNLTLNYGLRWELDTPLTDIGGHVQTFRPGQNTTVYPCDPNVTPLSECPTGLVVPGDKGVPAGMTQTYYKAFAPRIGIAYSPGTSGKTSFRAGWGMFYNPMEQLVLEQFSAEPPFGGSTFLYNTFLNTPYVGLDGTVNPNPFNGILNPVKGQDPGWANFRPILLFGEFQPHMRTQYSDQYNFTVQQQLAKDLLLQVGYVGSQGHRLLASRDLNPGNPQTCLDLQAMSNATGDGGLSCGPFDADNAYFIPTVDNGAQTVAPPGGLHVPYGPNGPFVIPAGTAISSVAPNGLTLVGLRRYGSPNCNPLTGDGCPPDGIDVFSNIFAEDTMANSSYNALEAMVEKRFSKGLQFQAAYTWSKSLDQASSFEETVNPFNPALSRALSLFNSSQRFVISYFWALPIPKHSGFLGRVIDDWAVSGITQFQTGFPIRLSEQDDTELLTSGFFTSITGPQLVGPFQTLNPQSSDRYYFNPNSFADPPLGQLATTRRTICCGPGLNNWDFAIHKQIPFSETKYLQFRAEIFNVFNHTQFYNPDGDFSDGAQFGQVTQAHDPRLVQFALKYYF